MNRSIKALFVIALFPKILQASFDARDILDTENKNIGAKIGYASVACKAYSQYAQAALEQDSERSDFSWQEFQKYRNKFHQTPAPYTQYLVYAGFGYWLYNRLAYPVGKKNWGSAKKTVAGVAIATWLHKKASMLSVNQSQTELLDMCTKTLENDSNLHEQDKIAEAE